MSSKHRKRLHELNLRGLLAQAEVECELVTPDDGQGWQSISLRRPISTEAVCISCWSVAAPTKISAGSEFLFLSLNRSQKTVRTVYQHVRTSMLLVTSTRSHKSWRYAIWNDRHADLAHFSTTKEQDHCHEQ